MSDDPYASPSSKLPAQTSRFSVVAIHFVSLLLLTSFFTVIIYKYGSVPGAVCVALAGIITSPILGFITGRRYGEFGVVTTAWAGALLALPLCLSYLAIPHPGDKFFILSALGYWAIPFFGLAAGLCGLHSDVHRSRGGT
jgi:hypothetical protein